MGSKRKIVSRIREEEGIDSESFGLNAEGTKSLHRKRENERVRTNGNKDEATVRERNGK